MMLLTFIRGDEERERLKLFEKILFFPGKQHKREAKKNDQKKYLRKLRHAI